MAAEEKSISPVKKNARLLEKENPHRETDGDVACIFLL
jgi:hypothetical protein